MVLNKIDMLNQPTLDSLTAIVESLNPLAQVRVMVILTCFFVFRYTKKPNSDPNTLAQVCFMHSLHCIKITELLVQNRNSLGAFNAEDPHLCSACALSCCAPLRTRTKHAPVYWWTSPTQAFGAVEVHCAARPSHRSTQPALCHAVLRRAADHSRLPWSGPCH